MDARVKIRKAKLTRHRLTALPSFHDTKWALASEANAGGSGDEGRSGGWACSLETPED